MRNTTISAHTTAAQTRERYGMLIIFLVLIISQFVSIELFTVHTMVISFEKLSAIVLYPIAIVLIGIRAIRVRKELILFSVLLYITFSISSAVSSGLSTAVLTNAIIIGMNAMVALLMYSVLLIDNKAIRTFFIIWIVCSVITSIICIGQFYEVLPLLDEPSLFRGQPRAEGLLKDPNYQALVLLFGLGALITLRSIRFRLLYIIIIVVGIASTMSRMGILGSLLLMLISPFFRHDPHTSQPIIRRYAIAITILSVTLALLFIPSDYQSRFTIRMNETFFLNLQVPVKGASVRSTQEQLDDLNSSTTRFLLLKQAAIGITEHPFTGIGLGNTPAYMAQTIGDAKEVHNLYMEILLVGGVAGLIFLLFTGFLILRYLIRCLPLDGDEEHESIFLYMIIFLYCAMLLSLVTFVLPWIVLTFALYGYDQEKDQEILQKRYLHD